jgi:hypothetical protein
MHPSGPRALAIDRFFAGITEYTFQTRLGVADPPLLEYLTRLLTRFIREDYGVRVRDTKGRPIVAVADMLAEAQQRQGDARRDVHQHIGDFTLFWSGLYPEALPKKQASLGKDQLIDYREQGKRAYWIASTIEPSGNSDDGSAPNQVLERLSRQFELCAFGLREVRREWERRDGDEELPRPFLIN